MRISLLAVILALLFVACHETKKQILQNEADSTPSEKPFGNLNKNKNCKNTQKRF
ncbi:hypothetical protein E5P57_05115 [Helicobacter pylori]|nr:hypothetical protein E5P57_05115 [Helicobacter pylori]